MAESCGSPCKFWKKNTDKFVPGVGMARDYENCGRCLRYPMDINDLDCYHKDDWCGEWREKVKE
jgi:hypothetical protein